jgi:hypothetical protein
MHVLPLYDLTMLHSDTNINSVQNQINLIKISYIQQHIQLLYDLSMFNSANTRALYTTSAHFKVAYIIKIMF